MNSILIAILRWRAAHHDRMTRALGAQVLAAQERQQWDGMGAIWRKREYHRQKRDVLTLRASALEARPQCCEQAGFDCRQGRDCPSRG